MNVAAFTMPGFEFRRPLNAVSFAYEIPSTTTSAMNSEDPDELVCWSESEESGSPVASADAVLHTIESARLDATNCSEVLSTIATPQAAACLSCDVPSPADALSLLPRNKEMVLTRSQSAER